MPEYTLTLNENEIGKVISSLSELPYKDVALLLKKIGAQLDRSLQKQQEKHPDPSIEGKVDPVGS